MPTYCQLASIILTAASLLAPSVALTEPLKALVTIRPAHAQDENLMIQGTVIKDAALPNELMIITVAHAKKEFCQRDTSVLLVEFRKTIMDLPRTFSVPCASYEVSAEADTGFISLKSLSANQTQRLKVHAAQLAAYMPEFKAITACSLVEKDGSFSKVRTVFDGSYVQSVTKYIPGCSGSPLFNSDGKISAVFKGFALESNRSLYTPITLKSIQPLVNKARKNPVFDTENLNDVLTYSLAGTRGDPLDGNPLLELSQSKLAVPMNLQRSEDIPTYFIMKLPLVKSVPNTSLIKEGSAYFSEQNPLLSCTYSPAANENSHEVQAGFKGVPDKILDLQRFNNAFTHLSLHLQYGGPGFKRLSEIRNSTKLNFGAGRGNYLWHLVAGDKFAVTLGVGSLQISDQDLVQTISFKDPNICTRLLSVYSPSLQSYIHYNISMHLFAGKDQLCPYLDVIVKRATSKNLVPKNLAFEDFDYVEHMVSLPNSSGEKCLK